MTFAKQEEEEKFLSLIQKLVQESKDFDFFKHKCLSVLEKVEWPVEDLVSYFEDLQPDDVLRPVGLNELHAQEVFQDSESLMEKYSILFDALSEAESLDAFKLIWPYQIAISQYAVYFKEDPKDRVAIGIEQLVWKEYPFKDACRDIENFLRKD